MPVVFRLNKISFTIYTRDHGPAHVHVKKDGAEVVVEIMTGRIIRNNGFSAKAAREISNEVLSNRDALMVHWEYHHGK